MYLAVDPGVKKVGYARFNSAGELLALGSMETDKFLDYVEENLPETIIYEGYFVNPHKHRTWSKSGTSETIGALTRIARKNSITLVEQRNTDLPIGLRLIGMYNVYYKNRKPIKHVDDEISALAHGTVYLIKNKIKAPPEGTSWL